MAHGSRGRWLRVATTGFGMVLCTGLVGCMNTDKPKEKVAAKQPGPGLTGTPTLPSGAGAGAVSKTGQPTGQYYGTPGTGVQPAGGFQPGAGAGAGPTRFGSNGINTNTSGQGQPYNNTMPPGTPGIISGPTQPGYVPPSMQPGQPVGMNGAPSQYLGSGAGSPGGTAFASPPSLLDMPLPPPPPMSSSGGGIESAGGVNPPVPSPSMAPIAPSMPPPSGGTGKGQPLSTFAPDVFGPK